MTNGETSEARRLVESWFPSNWLPINIIDCAKILYILGPFKVLISAEKAARKRGEKIQDDGFQGALDTLAKVLPARIRVLLKDGIKSQNTFQVLMEEDGRRGPYPNQASELEKLLLAVRAVRVESNGKEWTEIAVVLSKFLRKLAKKRKLEVSWAHRNSPGIKIVSNALKWCGAPQELATIAQALKRHGPRRGTKQT